MKSLSHVIHTYGFREQGSPYLHKKFLQRISENEEKLDHHTVSNLLYYLMFTDNTDEEIWIKMVQQTLDNKNKIPVPNYTAFKMSRYYMQHHFPSLDIRDYYDKFFYPERFFNTQSQEDKMEMLPSFKQFTKYLVNRFFIYPVSFVPFHNCFILRSCFMDQKVAVNFYQMDELIPAEGRINAKSKLDGKIMGYEGWEVLNIGQIEYDNMQTKERDEFFTAWFNKAKERQKKKGIIS